MFFSILILSPTIKGKKPTFTSVQKFTHRTLQVLHIILVLIQHISISYLQGLRGLTIHETLTLLPMQEGGLPSSRVRAPPSVNIDHLKCSICHDVLWKPVACQSCETPFCSTCINRWLANNPSRCPNQCERYTERKCPPFIAKLLAELQTVCVYQSRGCQQVVTN